jgi:signal transduction histidine kinase
MDADKIRVLVVEDDRDDFALTEEILLSVPGERYAVSWCVSYESALQQLRTEPFDVALVDYQIGVRTGLEFVSQVGPLFPRCPMILLTGLSNSDVDHAALSAGAADYLVKDSLNEEILDRSIRYARQHAERWALLDTVLNNAAAGMIALDNSGQPIIWNRQAITALGLTEHTQSTQAGVIRDALTTLIPHPAEHQEFRSATGEIYEVCCSNFAGGGQIVALQNITHRAQAEALLREAVADAEAASRAKSSFLATMSHELRTPLNGILGMVKVLENTITDEAQRSHVETIASSGQVLLHIINDILDLSKVEAGRMHIENVKFDLIKAVEDVIRLLAPTATAKGLELVSHIHPLTPRYIHGDPLRVKQILTNLVGNAVKFTEQGHVRVDVEARQLQSRWRLKFSVTDTGIGIAEDKLTTIFQNFVQADSSTTRRYGGSGLGLALSKELVSLMDGDMNCTSCVDNGSVFTFEISGGPVDASHAVFVQDKANSMRGVSLLVLVQQPAIKDAIRSFVEASGGKIHQAETAVDAAALIAREHFSHIIFDSIDDSWCLNKLIQFAEDSANDLRPQYCKLKSAYEPRDKNSSLADITIERPFFTHSLDQLRRPVAQPSPRIVVPMQAPVNAPSSMVRILLAEDDIANQRVAIAILKTGGHAPKVVSNGTEAVAQVESDVFDIILMDVNMPEMDGLKATRIIRELPNGKRVPIIGLTAHISDDIRKKCLEAGMTEYMTKPIDWSRLLGFLQAFEKAPIAVSA